jgi:hypothetical protein
VTLSARLRAAESDAFAKVSHTHNADDLAIYDAIRVARVVAEVRELADAIDVDGIPVTPWCEPGGECLRAFDHEMSRDETEWCRCGEPAVASDTDGPCCAACCGESDRFTSNEGSQQE